MSGVDTSDMCVRPFLCPLTNRHTPCSSVSSGGEPNDPPDTGQRVPAGRKGGQRVSEMRGSWRRVEGGGGGGGGWKGEEEGRG